MGGVGGTAGGAGGSAGASGGSGGRGGGGTGGAVPADAGPDAPLSCNGTHPLLDGGRYCKMGECRCEATDSCFPRNTVASCCRGNYQCFGGDGGVQCNGTHPLLDGGRYCGRGVCYCPVNDTCYSPSIATVCCGVTPTCTN